MACERCLYCGTAQVLAANERGTKFVVLSNPEFLAEGTAMKDLENPGTTVLQQTIRQQIRRQASQPCMQIACSSAGRRPRRGCAQSPNSFRFMSDGHVRSCAAHSSFHLSCVLSARNRATSD